MYAYVVAAALPSTSCQYDVSGSGRDGVNPARVSGDMDDVECLLDAPIAQVHVRFGHRACFGKSDNEFDLQLSKVAVLSGRLEDRASSGAWAIGPSTMDREDGQEHVRLFLTALLKQDEGTSESETTSVFATITYWCGHTSTRAIKLSTDRLSPAMKRHLDELRHVSPQEESSQHPYYSRVHGLVEALETILTYGSRERTFVVENPRTQVGGICYPEDTRSGYDRWN
jgi:hypothetical protein